MRPLLALAVAILAAHPGLMTPAALHLASYEDRLVSRRTLPLLPKAVPANAGVAAFAQNRRTAEALQALMLPACPG